ncbi:hypothetical protein BCV71DRAFT_280780 [Rhizopus microsporus]|uniref:dolichol kinase n=1 Tax=Rhizopus microsporus TaxID=58291 RepID=A0A1X0RKH5_RHIZD|nr:hypothetical protein BCV71DRAFT_280780 [Rhizopus microsporus]
MTILSVTLFQWLLYICVVALKKCFTLGEMTIVSKSTIILLYGTLEFTCITKPWRKVRHVFLTEFIDNYDLGPVILSHIYLLLGGASPVWTIGTIAFVIAIMGYAIWTIFMAAFFKAESASIIAGTSTSSSCIKYTLAILRTDKKEKDSRIIVLHLLGLVEVISGQNNKIILPMYMYSLTILTQFDT